MCVLICSEGFSEVDGECVADSLCELDEVEVDGVCYNIESTTELNLGGQELSGPIPAEIGDLTNLTTINLSYNSFYSQMFVLSFLLRIRNEVHTVVLSAT